MVRPPRAAQAAAMTTTSPPPDTGPHEAGPHDGGSHDGGPHDGGPRVTGAQVRDLGRLRRTVGPDRYVAGVAGGLARHLDVDPVLIRVALVVLTFFGGAGLLLYGVAWLLVPEDGASSAPLALGERSRTVALVLTGVVAALALVGDAWGPGFFPWPLALLALVAYLLLRHRASPDRTAYAAGAVPVSSPVSPGLPVAPPDPRRRGPRLLGFTVALAALGLGLLGLGDVAGLDVPDAGYPALVVAVVGAVLVLGAFWGRAGGLIALGLAATVALVAATAADRFDGERTLLTPATGAEVEDSYDLEFGELVLDLRDVAPEELDGRTVTVDGEAGRIEVVVPDGLSVEGRAEVHGPGAIEAFGSEEGGFDRSRELTGVAAAPGPGTGAPTLTLELELEAGQIEVTTR